MDFKQTAKQRYRVTSAQPKESARLAASWVSSLAMFSLAAGLFYLAYQLAHVSHLIPSILDQVEQLGTKADPLVKEIGKLGELVPPILTEIEQTRKLVPDILKESQEYRKQLPAVLDTANQASAAVSEAASQIEATRPLVPKVLQEVQQTRKSIPAMLDRADQVVARAGQAGKEASQGAVTGVFTGIIAAPFKLLGGVGKTVLGTGGKHDPFTDKDYELVEKAIQATLEETAAGTSRQWNNADSGHHGKVTDTTPSASATGKCRTLETIAYHEEQMIAKGTAELCRDAKGVWVHKE